MDDQEKHEGPTAMTTSKPKLLHELNWYHKESDPKKRCADVCGYTIIEDVYGTYTFICPDFVYNDTPEWFDLDPITAQAVLIDIQQTNPPDGPPPHRGWELLCDPVFRQGLRQALPGHSDEQIIRRVFPDLPDEKVEHFSRHYEGDYLPSRSP